jgi:hypothetical protein
MIFIKTASEGNDPNLAKQIMAEFENSAYHSEPHEKYTKKITEKLQRLIRKVAFSE